MTGQMSSFFDEMLEAAKAKEALPTIQHERDEAISRNRFLEDRVTELGNRIVAMQAEITAKEVALRDATKSATDNKSHLDLLLDEVRKAMGQVAVATDIVDPKPEPEVVELPNPLASGQSAQTTGGDTSHSVDPLGLVNNPFVEQRAESDRIPTDTGYGVSQSPFVEPTYSSGNDPSTGIGGTTQPSGQSEVPDASPPTTVTPWGTADTPSGQSDANPTPQSTPVSAENHTSSGTTAESSGSQFKPDPKPYWLKPSNLTWGEWKERGNDVPYWAKDDADIMNTV